MALVSSLEGKKEWTGEEVWDLLQRSEKAVIRAVLALYKEQEPDERALEITKHLNNRGFNATDAPFGSSIARQVLDGNYLTQSQINSCRKMLRKYCGQLSRIANAT